VTLGSSTRSRYTRSRRCELKTQEVWVRAHLFNAALVEQRRHILCGTGQAGRREPVLFHPRRSPQLSRPGHHPSNPRRPPAARSDDRQAAGALASAAGVARAADRARLCLSPVRTKPTKGIVTATNLTRVPPVSGGVEQCSTQGPGVDAATTREPLERCPARTGAAALENIRPHLIARPASEAYHETLVPQGSQ